MRRAGRPALSPLGQEVLDQYEQQLRTAEDLTAATIRNYLSDLHHFAAWYESMCCLGREEAPAFRPEAITMPTMTDYRAYLQQTPGLKPNSVNRSLISLKRYFAWLLTYNSTLQKPSHDMTPLFPSEKRRTQLIERGLGYLIKKYATKANLHNVSPHDLRHRFGYHMAMSVPLHRLAQLMGHDSLNTTMRYVQGTRSDLQQAVETIAWV